MLRNLGSVWFRTLVTIAVVFVSKRFVLEAIGVAHNDLWVTLNLLLGWLALVAAGVPMSTTRQVARRRATGDVPALNRTVGTAVGIYCLLGAVALLVGLLAFPLYDALYLTKKVSPDLREDAIIGYAILVVMGAFSFLGQLPYGVLNGHQDFLRPNLVASGCFVLKLVLFLVVLPFWPSVTACCLISLAILGIEWAAARSLLALRYPELRLKLSTFDRTEAKDMAKFSSWSLLLNLGLKLSFMVNGFVLAVQADEGAPTRYDAASTPFLYLLPLVIAIGQVMMPRITTWKERGEDKDLREAYLVWSKLGTAFGLLPLIWLAVEGRSFLQTWMPEAFGGPLSATAIEAGLTMTILALGTILFLPVRGLAMQMMMAMGYVKEPSLLFLAGGGLNLLLALLLIPNHGLLGAAISTAVSTSVLAVAMIVAAARRVNLSPFDYSLYVFGRTGIAGLITGGALFAWSETRGPTGYGGLLISGAGACVLYGLSFWLIAARSDDRLPWYRVPEVWRKRLRGRA